MEDKILFEALSMKGTDWRVVAYLLRHPPEAQIVSDGEEGGASYVINLQLMFSLI